MKLEVGEERAGERLDSFLASQFASRAAAARAIDAGGVSVDGASRPRSWRVSAGELVEVTPAAQERPDPAEVPFDIVFEDEHLMVVDKPAGVVVHPAPGHDGATLAEALAGRAAGGDDAYGGAECGRRLGLRRQFLHSYRLMFSHPVTRESIASESKPPADLRPIIDVALREPVSEGPDGG